MNRYWLYFLIIAGSFLLSAKVFAADQIKTNEYLVVSSNTQVSSAINTLFTIYIGDNISGVTNPVKSAYFTVSGVYTGNGTLQFMLNSDPNTSRVFTLPNVANAAYFELLYQDPTGKINPATAGAYSYTLNTIPSGVTISGLVVKSDVTYQYTPSACPDGPSASNDKMKTTKYLITSYNTPISSAINSLFSIYIGDNISSITHPVKSAYFTVSGVYTGGGTLQFMLNSDPSTSQVITFPTVYSATYFELLYQDPTGKINPATAGTYSYTLNTIPSGITISGLAVKAVITHRYKPPSCGGMPIKGELISNIFDTAPSSTGAAYNSLLWMGNLGGPSQNQGKVRIQLAVSNTSTGPWIFIGGPTCSGADWYDITAPNTPVEINCFPQINNSKYFKYKVQICSNDCVLAGTFTPTVNNVVVNWSP